MAHIDPDALKQTFDRVAELYDRARPDYPKQLFDDLVTLAALGDSSLLLEIGCGTGKATVPLARRGHRIVCLEPGPRLADVATRHLSRYPNVEVVVEPFETWDPGAARFDLIFAATSWHWIDARVRYQKAASLLREGGQLAFFGARHAFPADVDPMFEDIQAVYEVIGHAGDNAWFPDHDRWPPPLPEDVPDETQEIVSSGLFDDVRVRRYVWEQRYDADAYIELLDTFSVHIDMEREKRDYLHGEIRKRIEARPDRSLLRHWLAILHVATRVATSRA